jgi:hypothetical protein
MNQLAIRSAVLLDRMGGAAGRIDSFVTPRATVRITKRVQVIGVRPVTFTSCRTLPAKSGGHKDMASRKTEVTLDFC